jgi:integrase/recombinase XerC
MAEAARNIEQQALIGLCGFAGLRVAEALGLTLPSIDLSLNLITVRGKGDKTRIVPMSSSCWLHISQQYMAVLTKGTEDGNLYLISYQDRFARKCITLCAERAGIQRHVSSHDLRATFATAVYDNTKDLRLVQELLGHSSPNTTQVYTGVTLVKMRDAVQL